MKQYSDYMKKVENLIRDKIIEKIISEDYNKKHVLVFLAGVDEINLLLNKFKEYENVK